ncbi:MAG: hypothetical protein Q8P67_28340, partial [archaeon]|nr:hypothetical protein [archaeon]
MSGSGKTRHMYEALCLRFGFYFVGNNSDNGVSEDLKTLCGNIVETHKLRPDIVNRKFAEDQFKMLTFWRWSIYLKIREQFEKLGNPLSAKQWLLMQTYPEAVLGEDIFSDLLPLPMDVRSLPRNYLNSLLSDIPPDTPLFLDEAQCLPTDPIFSPFSGNSDDETRRMILSPLVSAIRKVLRLRMVIAGTGLSLKSIPEFPNRMFSFDKRPPLEITNLGGFYTREQIASCLNTFKFPDLARDAESVQYLFDRIRGRHRFLVTVLTTLSQRDTHDHQTLQEVCREYIEKMTTSERVGSLYAQIRNVTLGSGPSSRSPAIQLRRLQTAEYQDYFYDLSMLVLHFRYYSLPLAPPTDAQAILLEYALCRFVKGSNSVSIDEPLVVLAYTRCIEPHISQSLLYRNIITSPTSAA